MNEGLRIYNLFPTLAGTIRDWMAHLPRIAEMQFNAVYINPFHYPGFSGSLYAVKDYYRLNPRFRGEEPEPRPGVRGGHMPGARNVHYASLLAPDGTMKSAAELRAIFEAAGVNLASPIVTTCGSGVTAALLALGLARLGREDVAVYDGSRAEWGGRSDTAVVTGS